MCMLSSLVPEATYGEFNQSNESPVLPDLMCDGTEYSLSDCPGFELAEVPEGYCGENQAGVRCVEGTYVSSYEV